jgi:hypothetical protein
VIVGDLFYLDGEITSIFPFEQQKLGGIKKT